MAGKLIIGVNDLCSQYPQVVSEFNIIKNKGIDITKLFATSHKKVWWKCKEGHEWKAIISARTAQG